MDNPDDPLSVMRGVGKPYRDAEDCIVDEIDQARRQHDLRPTSLRSGLLYAAAYRCAGAPNDENPFWNYDVQTPVTDPQGNLGTNDGTIKVDHDVPGMDLRVPIVGRRNYYADRRIKVDEGSRVLDRGLWWVGWLPKGVLASGNGYNFWEK